jgi:hypothetical protein
MAVKHELDQLYVTNPTAEPFSVKWGGVVYSLQPQEQKIWMRFLAEHFAKYLADSILMKREQQHKKDYLARGGSERDYVPKSYLNSRQMRPEVIDSILVGMYQYHQGQQLDPNAMIQQQIDQMNPQQRQERPMDLGEAADPLYGVLKDDQPDENIVPPVQTTPPPVPPPPMPTAAQPGASMIPSGDMMAPPPAPQQPPTLPADSVVNDDDAGMKAIRLEAAKLGLTIPVGVSKERAKEMIQKQYA